MEKHRRKKRMQIHTIRYQRDLPLHHRKTLNNAITFAENYMSISKEDIRIIKQCMRSLLLYENKAWKKKDTDTTIDVMLGSYDGEEFCNLIGIYRQSLSTNILSKVIWIHKRRWVIYLS